jgi:2-methylcitrate dehydratase PrpD
MIRRDFGKTLLYLVACLGIPKLAKDVEAETQAEFPEIHGLTDYVARFIVETPYQSIPSDVLELGKKSILDGLGLALAGSRAQSGPLCLRYLDTFAIRDGKSTIIGSERKTAPQLAAFVNGVSIHADDYDDTQLSAAKDRVYGLLVHPTVPVLPGALALSEQGGVSGKEFMLAYHVGVEVECKVAEAISPRHYQDGFHSTGTCGPFGSAAACSRLMHLDVPKTLSALGIAAAESGGLRENFGTMTKPFQAGHAAESGFEAAELASIGWTAAQQILEAQRGFFRAFGGSFEPSFIVDRLGNPWTFASPGVSLKPYPSGSLTHPAMTEMARLIEQHDIQPSQVDKVDIGANHDMTTTLLHHHPKTGLEAKFSMEFCLAILLLERKAGLGQFTDQAARRPDVQEMIGKINYYVDPEAEQAGFDKMTSILRIHLKNGEVIAGRAQFGKGSPADPMSFEEAAVKFRGCAEYAEWPKEKTEGIITFVKTLENAPDMKVLAPMLSSEKA